MYYTLQSRKEYVNPYRHGVYIGNFIEDLISQDLVKKHKEATPDLNQYVSEVRDKYCNPSTVFNKNIKAESNRKPNFDLNIDFSKKTMQDINSQIQQNIVNNNNRLAYLEKSNQASGNTSTSLSNHNSKIQEDMKKDNKMEDFLCNSQRDNILSNYSDYSMEIQKQIGKQTDNFIRKDLVGLYFTTRSGQANNLLKGHGPNQYNFDKNEFISVKE